MPRGTTQRVTRGASNDWCQMYRWRLDQSDGDTWHWRVSVRGTVADLDVVIPIPPGIDERCFNAESDLLESLLNRDSPIDSTKIDSIFDEFSLPRPPEESNSEYSVATIESLFPSPIPVEDSDSLMEEIDLFLASDDSMPTGIEIVDYDSEGDIRFLEELT
ncbi:hypothetical protein Tco_1474531 [Tanacetum coccineum]